MCWLHACGARTLPVAASACWTAHSLRAPGQVCGTLLAMRLPGVHWVQFGVVVCPCLAFLMRTRCLGASWSARDDGMFV